MRVEITVTTIKPVCPYCQKRPVKRVTCGDVFCQFKHHILEVRKIRKTDRKVPCRQIKF